MKLRKNKNTTKLALLAGAAALATFAPQSHAQSSDALIDKLVDKGVLTVDEAKDLREESDKDFKTALQAKTGMPDWVTSYKIGGDFRGRYEQFSATDNSTYINRTRFRYRLRFGIVANILDNMEVGFRLGSGDAVSGTTAPGQGNPLSQNSTMNNNWSDKGIYVDAAYAKWTALNTGDVLLAGTFGKMDNPFNFTPMVFDPDLTPEGAAITGAYTINDKHTVAFTAGAFVLDENTTSTRDPGLFGGQILVNSKWTPKVATSVGFGAMLISSSQQLSAANVPYINQGNTRNTNGVPIYNYNPIIADASVTYTLDSFPLYNGAFPIKVGGELIDNPAAGQNNAGYWLGLTLGKSGTKNTWDLSYRYEYLEADAWYDQMVDDDNGAYYQNSSPNKTYSNGYVSSGYFGGTNIKGHRVQFNYSITDSLTFSFTGYLNELINSTVYGGVKEPNSTAVHVMADLAWKF